jgi:hypothetical protein
VVSECQHHHMCQGKYINTALNLLEVPDHSLCTAIVTVVLEGSQERASSANVARTADF